MAAEPGVGVCATRRGPSRRRLPLLLGQWHGGRERPPGANPTPQRTEPEGSPPACPHPGGFGRDPLPAEVDAGVVRVTDDGPGVPADRQDRIFDTFYRADDDIDLPDAAVSLPPPPMRGRWPGDGGAGSEGGLVGAPAIAPLPACGRTPPAWAGGATGASLRA